MIYTLYIVKYCKKIMYKGPLIIYCTGGGGLRRNWGAFKFFKPERGALKKYRETKEGEL